VTALGAWPHGRKMPKSKNGFYATEPVYTLIGARIRMIREALDITQGDLAKRLHMTRGSLANIELGRQRVLLHSVDNIAKALGTTQKHLLRGIWF